MRSGRICRSSALSPPSAAMASISFLRSWPIPKTRIPEDARLCLRLLVAQLTVVKQQILENDRRVLASARRTDVGRRLMDIPGIGPLLASAFVATVADPAMFRTGRDLAAWIGLVPKQNSSGGAAWRHIKGRQPLPQTNARRRRDGSDQVCT